MKSILLPLTANAGFRHVEDVAISIAKAFSASLTGLFVAPDPRTTIPYMGEGLTADMIQELCKAAAAENEEQLAAAKSLYTSLLAEHGLSITQDKKRDPAICQAHWKECSGLIADHIGRRARTADLSVCSKPIADSSDSEEIFNDLIYRSGRPVLMVSEGHEGYPGSHILIAWNGRAEGARALGAALPMLRCAKKVTLLQIGEPEEDRPGLDQAADYLHDHSLSITILNPSPDGSPIGEQILSIAEIEKADMLVIGAYSHSRWREMILGGVTRHLVNHSTIPVFMSH